MDCLPSHDSDHWRNDANPFDPLKSLFPNPIQERFGFSQVEEFSRPATVKVRINVEIAASENPADVPATTNPFSGLR